jgi:hypothetical protein
LQLKIETRLGLTQRAAQTQVHSRRARERLETMNRLNQDLTRNPDDPRIPWELGQTAHESGWFLLAARCFQASLALDPTFGPARASLAALHSAHPELARAPGRPTLLPPGAGVALPSVSATP